MKLMYIRLAITFLLLQLLLCACSNQYDAYFQGVYLYFNGEKYIEVDGIYEESDEKLCKTSDGYTIYEVVGDQTHDYVVVRSFLDQYLYVRESYVPENNTIRGVCIGSNTDYICQETLVSCISLLESNDEMMDNVDEFKQAQRTEGKVVGVAFDNEAVGKYIGVIFCYNNQYMYYSYKKDMVTIITDEQFQILKEYIE